MYFFQQDNAPCPKARIVQEWFHNQASEFSLMHWPAQSPDIEHLLEEMEQDIRSRDPQPANLTQLWEELESKWASIPVEHETKKGST
jgi:arsenate reductase-like glutaredoxin family protein